MEPVDGAPREGQAPVSCDIHCRRSVRPATKGHHVPIFRETGWIFPFSNTENSHPDPLTTQGRLGNCYFLAAIASCADGDEDLLIRDLVVEQVTRAAAEKRKLIGIIRGPTLIYTLIRLEAWACASILLSFGHIQAVLLQAGCRRRPVRCQILHLWQVHICERKGAR